MRMSAQPAADRLPISRLLAATAVAALIAAAGPALASGNDHDHDHDHDHDEETRGLDAHVHGVGNLEIAFDGSEIALRFEVPAADLVGFEHEPSTDEQRAAIDDAIAALAQPASLFVLPAGAGCVVREASAARVGPGEEEEHDHDDHAHGEHDHDDEHAHGDGDHDEHAHGDDDHAHGDHDHDDEHAHDDHDEAVHSEFHADVLMTCDDPGAVDSIEFAYFERFPNAETVETIVVGPGGAASMEATREEPVISLRGVL